MRNILASGRANWKFIDPRGLSGETAYDVAVLSIRVARLLPSQNLAASTSRMASVEMERVQAWMAVADTARV
jgi:streptomycin 6-kinase